MSSLTGFILIVIVITITITFYTYKKLKEPLDINYLTANQAKRKNNQQKFLINAEIMNGRLAMIGFLGLLINYKIYGWIFPGTFLHR